MTSSPIVDQETSFMTANNILNSEFLSNVFGDSKSHRQLSQGLLKHDLLTAPESPAHLDVENLVPYMVTAPLYQKTSMVNVKTARVGQSLQTVLSDGTVETENFAEEGDVLITNPGGEQYFLAGCKFRARYVPTPELGVWKSTGKIRAILNPLGQSISILAPWGSIQYGGPHCMVAVALGEEEKPYLIGFSEFNETYTGI